MVVLSDILENGCTVMVILNVTMFANGNIVIQKTFPQIVKTKVIILPLLHLHNFTSLFTRE